MDEERAAVCANVRANAASRSQKSSSWQEEGGERGREGEILTDFAVGIGLFSAGTEVRILPPPSPPQQVYSLLLQTEPTGAHSIEL